MDIHTQKIGWLLSSSLAIAGTLFDSAQSVIGLIALILSVLVSLILVINGLFNMCHNVHQRNKDLKEERDQLAAEKKAMEDIVCEERRRTGVCPMSTFCKGESR